MAREGGEEPLFAEPSRESQRWMRSSLGLKVLLEELEEGVFGACPGTSPVSLSGCLAMGSSLVRHIVVRIVAVLGQMFA